MPIYNAKSIPKSANCKKISYVHKSQIIRMSPDNFCIKGMGVAGSQFAICICELQKEAGFGAMGEELKDILQMAAGE